ncbi:MAG: hypothetical protein K2Q06_00275 [Parvularculaceae bacterium]|nr:hypothetical protein [Parvularculaceae bacterium]
MRPDDKNPESRAAGDPLGVDIEEGLAWIETGAERYRNALRALARGESRDVIGRGGSLFRRDRRRA